MTLDPQFRTILDALETAGVVPLVRGGPAETRQRYRDMVNARRGPGFVPEPVASVRDGSVPGPGGDIPVRTYVPEADGGAVVVYLHGGGWMIGDLESHDPHCRRIANATGAVVVAVDYRLAPEHKHPAALEDATAVVQHVAGAYPGRPLGVAGDSAGATLSFWISLRARDAGPRLAGQLLFYPGVDPTLSFPSMTENGSGYFLTADEMRYFWSSYLPDGADGRDPAINPLHADVRGVAPAVVGTAEFDPLRDEGAALAAHLERSGVPVRYVEGPGMIHAYAGFQAVIPAAGRITAEALDAFRDLLAGAGDRVS